MILNNAENIMYGNAEVQKIYCGGNVVWERQSPEPVRPVPEGYENMDYFTFPEPPNQRPINTEYRPATIPAKMETRIMVSQYTPTGQTVSALVGGFDSAPISYKDYYTFYIPIEYDGTVHATISGQKTDSTLTTVLDAPILQELPMNTWTDISAEWSRNTVKLTVGSFYNDNQLSGSQKFKGYCHRDVWIGSNGDPSGSSSDMIFAGDMKFFKLYQGDGTLARDMVPARRLSDSREGFWDFITETFYTYTI